MIDLSNIENLKITQDNFDEVINLMEQKYQETGISPLDPVNKTLYGFNIECVDDVRTYVTKNKTNKVYSEKLNLYIGEEKEQAIKIGKMYLATSDFYPRERQLYDILEGNIDIFNRFSHSVIYAILGKEELRDDFPIVDKVWLYLSPGEKGVSLNVF